MSEIPAWAYIVVGGVVAGFSKFVEARSGKTMTLFIFIGLVFVAIGIGKLALSAFLSRNKPRQATQAHLRNQQARIGQGQFQGQRNGSMRQAQGQPAAMHHTHAQQQAYHNAPSNLNFRSEAHHHVRQVQPKGGLEHPSIISCPACGVNHYSYANFCMMCGALMRKR